MASLEWLPDHPSESALAAAANGALDELLIGDLLEKRALGRFFVHCISTTNAKARELEAHGGGGPAVAGLAAATDLVATFRAVFEAKRGEIDDAVERMEKGLKVMATAVEDSVKLKTAVTELQLVSEEKREEFEGLKALAEKEEARVLKEEGKVRHSGFAVLRAFLAIWFACLVSGVRAGPTGAAALCGQGGRL